MIFFLLPLFVSTVFGDESYMIHTHTADVWWAGTDSTISASIMGTQGTLDNLVLDLSWSNDHERNTENHFFFDGPDVGELNCIELMTDGEDAWMVDWVSISSKKNKKEYFMKNVDNTTLSTDKSEGSDILKLCVKYVLNIRAPDFDSTIPITALITGTKGNISSLNINKINDLGELIFDATNIGEIKCIQFVAEITDTGKTWLVDWLSIYSPYNWKTVYMYNGYDEEKDSSLELSNKEPRFEFCVQGDETFKITTHTADPNGNYGGSDCESAMPMITDDEENYITTGSLSLESHDVTVTGQKTTFLFKNLPKTISKIDCLSLKFPKNKSGKICNDLLDWIEVSQDTSQGLKKVQFKKEIPNKSSKTSETSAFWDAYSDEITMCKEQNTKSYKGFIETIISFLGMAT